MSYIIDAQDTQSHKQIQKTLKKIMGNNIGRLGILCTGTDRWTGDSLGPIVGEELKNRLKENVIVLGTLQNPLKSEQVPALCEKMRKENRKVIVIDSALGNADELHRIIVSDGPVFLGRALNKSIRIEPDATIRAVINISGFMEQAMLQNTRLFHVMRISKPIIEGIAEYCSYFAGAKTLI